MDEARYIADFLKLMKVHIDKGTCEGFGIAFVPPGWQVRILAAGRTFLGDNVLLHVAIQSCSEQMIHAAMQGAPEA